MAVQMSGLTGTRALKMSDVTAPALIAYTPQFGNRKVRNMHDWLKPLPVPPEALLVNRGGQRGVLPCGDAWGYSKVIRRQLEINGLVYIHKLDGQEIKKRV